MPMETVAWTSLWMPIMISAVAAFAASFLFWAVLGWHNKDWPGLPDEEAVRKGFQVNPPPPGQYAIPYCGDRKEMTGEAHLAKVKEGPVTFLVVMPNAMPNMAKMMGGWFAYLIGVCCIVAYITGLSLGPGAEFMPVFRVAGTTAILGFCAALIPNAIWFGRTWSSIFKEVVDGLVYGLLTGAIFAWLWPAG